MCGFTLSSDPTHPYFWFKMRSRYKNPKNYFSKKYVTKKSPPTQKTQWSKKCWIRLMRSALIGKASQNQ